MVRILKSIPDKNKYYVRISAKKTTRSTNSGDECGIEGILREAKQDACFANAGIANKQKLEQVVICFRHVTWYAVCLSNAETTRQMERQEMG